MSLDTFLKETS
jgi:hypothetical protein